MNSKFLYLAWLWLAGLAFSKNSQAQGNTANPYDEVGAAHNSILASFFTDYSKERVIREQMSSKDLSLYVCNTASLPDCDALQELANQELVAATKEMSLQQVADYLQAKRMVSSACANYIHELNKAVSNHIQITYEACYRAIISLENRIQADAQLPEKERIQLLLASTVARHSAKFWKDWSEGITSYAGLSHLAIATNDTLQDLINQDVGGAIIGAYIGIFSGGTINTLKSSLVLAAIGSIGRAAVKYWNWGFR